MKAKHLLMALALPGVFAACSQEDDFVSQAPSLNDGRPVVGVISLNIPEAASTRWDWSSALGFTFDNNDYIGAALMDTYDGSETNWDEKYTIVDYINTNYKYGYAQGWTNNDAVMSEGNYFFYMPYNANLKSRAGLELNVPVEQYAYDETAESPVADDTYSWKKNQMFIGYDDIKVDDQQAAPQMVEVFAKPRFNINYTGNGSTEVERIVLTDKGSSTPKFRVKATLKATGTVTNYNPINGNSIYDGALSGNVNLAEVFRAYNEAVAEYELKEGESFKNPLNGNFGTFIANAETSNFLSLNFVPAKTVTGLMVVPPTNMTAANTKIEIYTSKGLVTIDNLTDFDDVEQPADNTTGITYSNLDALSSILSGAGSKANAITINFADVDVKQPASVTVATTSQLESIIRWYEDPNGAYPLLTDPKTLTINLTGDVELTEKVYNAIKGNPNISFKFASTANTLTIPAEIPADALSLLDKQSNAAIVIEGTQSLANATNAAVTYSYNVEVAEEGTLNVNGGEKGITIADVENNGTVNVDGKVTFTEVTNYDALTVNANATLTGKVLNNAIASTGNPTMYTAQAVLTNNGTLNLSADSENQCKIVNNNDLYIKGVFENSKVDAVPNGTNGYTGVIENADETNSYIYAEETFTNKGEVYNKGAMYSRTGGAINNETSGYVMAYDGATTYVNENDGDIELEERDTETQVISGEGSKSYTLKDSDLNNKNFVFDDSSDKFNTLKIGMDVKFSDKGKLPESIVVNAKNNLTITCVEGCSFTKITAMGGGRHMLRGTKVQAESLTVAANTVFQIPALSSFGVYGDTTTGTIDNEGEILVGGDFYSDIADEPEDGIWSKAGDGSYHWNNTADDFSDNQNNG